jgi:hypothetical protein
MATVADSRDRLLETDGFLVESSAGDLGWIEEVWVDETGDADAVAVRTADGRHGLLLDEDVLTVDRESRWVVVSPDTTFLELDTPHVTRRAHDGTARFESSWATTGGVLEVAPRPRHLWHVPYRPEEPVQPARRRRAERPLWQGIAALLLLIALLVVVTIALAYLIAGLVTGAAP